MLAAVFSWRTLLLSAAVFVPLTACDLDEGVTAFQGTAFSAFASGGSGLVGRSGHIGARLPDGRVMVAGGMSGITRLASSEIFDPTSLSWQTTGSMGMARLGHVVVTLADGRVLVVGGASANTGSDPSASNPTVAGNTTEIFDPATGTWSRGGSTVSRNGTKYIGRTSPAAVRLADGRVLLAGGGNRNGLIYTFAEIWNPATGLWTATGPMNVGRQGAAAVLLNDGLVLVAGGFGAGPTFASLASAEIYDPATGTWKLTGAMRDARMWTGEDAAAGSALALLPDGRVLTAGGVNRPDRVTTMVTYLNRAEVFDPATGTWTPTGPLATARTRHQTTLLNSGKVLVLGGQVGSSPISSAEVYDPASGQFVDAGSLTTARFDHSANRLNNGNVLLAQGQGPAGALASAEIFEVNQAPVADAGAEVTGLEGAAVNFDATRSSDPDGQSLTFEWTFGDGSSPAFGATPSHTYLDDGDYAVELTVSDGNVTTTAGTMARIANVAPSAEALPGATQHPGDNYSASGSFSDPGADSWTATVDYGDGSGAQPLSLTGTTFALSHAFTGIGSFVVTVSVSDDDGGVGGAQATVVVAAVPPPPVVEVKPREAIAKLIALVNNWASHGVIKRQDAREMTHELLSAIRELSAPQTWRRGRGGDDDDGDNGRDSRRSNKLKAVRDLQAFIRQVQHLESNRHVERKRRLSHTRAVELIGEARSIITAIQAL